MKQNIAEQARKLGSILAEKKLTVTTAESCTGGGIACAITAVPGSSEWFNESFVTYSNQAKIKLVGVKEETLREYGAVSGKTVEEMAQGACVRAEASLAVAVSGIAGPGGGTPDKPVGTVWIGAASSTGELWSCCYNFTGDREAVREQTVVTALGVLIRMAREYH